MAPTPEGVASISDVQFPQFRSAPNFAPNEDVKKLENSSRGAHFGQSGQLD